MSSGRQATQQAQQATTQQQPSEFDKLLTRSVKFTPFAEQEEIELSFGQVKSYISARTKKGLPANDADIVKFMMLCKARQLNPWVGDAYLVGYDTSDGPQFSLITSMQALMKRAEASPDFDGMESGVIVRTKDGIVERQGDATYPGETLIGGWAKLWKKNVSRPFYDSLNLGTYDKGHSQWNKDKAGMIVKCAEASVLRKAFPSQLSGLYTRDEGGRMQPVESDRTVYSESPRERLVSAIQVPQDTRQATTEVVVEPEAGETAIDPDGEMGSRE